MLGLPGWVVSHTAPNVEDPEVLDVFATLAQVPGVCLACGEIGAPLYRHGFMSQRIHDTNLHGKKAVIVLERQRYRCRSCKGTFLQPLPDVDDKRNMTKRLLDYIQRQSIRKTFAQVADDVGVNPETVRRIFRDHIGQLATEWVPVTPYWMGIDEIYLIRKFRAVLTNIREGTIFEMLETNRMADVIAYFQAMPHPDRIELVTMDMHWQYKEAVHRAFPEARIVVDKFHVVRQANRAVELIRIAYKKTLNKNQRRALTRDRWVMLKRRDGLKPEERLILDSWTGVYEPLRAAYEAKEAYMNLWDATLTRSEAEAAYDAWEGSLTKEMRKAFTGLIRATRNWREEVFSYFDFEGATNATTESLNNLIREKHRLGRGYQFDAIRAKVLYNEPASRRQAPSRMPLLEYPPPERIRIYDPSMGSGGFLGVAISTLMEELERGDL